MTRNPDPHIYFIRPVGQIGPIKVGHSINVPLRLRDFNKWSPLELYVAALLPVADDGLCSQIAACNALERRFHLRYADYRLHGEWFADHPLILTDIDNINAGAFDLECLPDWRRASNAFIRREYSGPIGRYSRVAEPTA